MSKLRMPTVENEEDSDSFWMVQPSPAFCIKFKDGVHGLGKVFLNFCTCDQLPPPADDIDEEQLATIIESEDPGRFRIPLSVGEIHQESDKSNQSCAAIDVIINSGFYAKRVKDSELFRTFLILVAVDAVEIKHKINLDPRNYISLQNRKAIGEIQTQRIRKRPAQPLIMEVNSDEKRERVPAVNLTNRKTNDGKYILEASIKLPGVKSASQVELQLAQDRLKLNAANETDKTDKQYHLDIGLPVLVRVENATSHFNLDNSLLQVVMPCQ